MFQDFELYIPQDATKNSKAMRLVYPFVPATAKEETEEELRRAMDASAEVEIVGSSFAPKSEGLQAVQREANFEGQDDIKDQAKAAGAAGVNLQGQAKVAGTVGVDLQGQAKAVPAPGGKGDKNGPEATGQPAGEPASQPPASSTALAAAESQSDERAGQAADKGEAGDNDDEKKAPGPHPGYCRPGVWFSDTFDGKRLEVVDRRDRVPLISVKLNGRQICQATQGWFGQNTQAGVDLMVTLAKKVRDGLVKAEPEAVREERDKMLADLGYGMTRKRPAAAPAAPEEAGAGPAPRRLRRCQSSPKKGPLAIPETWEEQVARLFQS